MSNVVTTKESDLHRAVGVLSVYIACVSIFALAAVAQGSRSSLSADAARGEKVFDQSCASCHEAHSRNQLAGPGLKGYYTRRHPAPNDVAVREVIKQGKGAMPSFSSFSDSELTDLIAYLRTL
jgi:mono/diheme cytochrome c family protein